MKINKRKSTNSSHIFYIKIFMKKNITLKLLEKIPSQETLTAGICRYFYLAHTAVDKPQLVSPLHFPAALNYSDQISIAPLSVPITRSHQH